ncbi:KilA-N domain-containing protein [Acinetobacter sp. B10A]|uniref:KilA-N domain-containing protein n=1 Tax=Acinetobacter baretiae TaxID=2605383 RepID=UPI001B3C5898|nr:KilA-N domain-containing protein [Acinetobacter baretiae]MBF7685920.1 KilA-N domain-containing protein [Acinetobacter baretiae]
MVKDKNRKIDVNGISVTVSTVNNEDFICITDIVRPLEDGLQLIDAWLRSKDTLEFIGTWERINNSNFNSVEFDRIRNEAGTNRFRISAKKWIEAVNAIGLIAKAGRYGGTHAHKDIAFEFCSWLSPEFKLYLIKEFQRLKEDEAQKNSIEWQVKRELAKVNYRAQTDAIQQNLLDNVPKDKQRWVYVSEADLLNLIVFGQTAKEWRDNNKDIDGNRRDHCSALENALLANLESYNSILIAQKLDISTRASELEKVARTLRQSMSGSPAMQRLEDQSRPILTPDNKKIK